MNNQNYTLYSWQASPYSAKVRAYFRYRGIPFVEKTATLWVFQTLLAPKVGQRIIPVVIADTGEVLQDSQDIITTVEGRQGETRIYSDDPVVDIANRLLELYADEMMILSAMHYRWQTPGNKPHVIADFGASAAPWLPKPVQKLVGTQVAKQMQAHLRRLGLEGDMPSAIRAWTEQTMTDLNALFASQDYLFGNRPLMADFSLYGPLYAHLYRDLGTRTEVEKYPNLLAWIKRLERVEPSISLEEPLSAEGVIPLLQSQFLNQLPMLIGDAQRLTDWQQNNPGVRKVPVQVGARSFNVNGVTGKSLARTFPLWRLQGVQDYYQGLSAQDRSRVDDWLGSNRLDSNELHKQALTVQFPRIKREKFRLYFAAD